MIQYQIQESEAMMAPAVRRKKRKDEIKVSIAPFHNMADYKACIDIQREVWHLQDLDIFPVPLLLVAARTGGILLGAYNSLGDLIGFAFSILGALNGEPVQHSCMLAVRAAYRNFDVGFKLKMAQRKESLKRKITAMTSSFDPMLPMNAYFALGKLSVRASVYEEDFCGETTSSSDRGLPTDRLIAYWGLESHSVARRLETGPLHHDFRKELKQHPIINHLVETAPGMTNSSAVKLNCTEDQFLFEVPYNLPEIKNRDLGVALEWQGKLRQVFRHYFKKDYAATDFWVVEQDGRLRAFYFLEKNK
jgi:predicted GNAT superfamily acetyltransferase